MVVKIKQLCCTSAPGSSAGNQRRGVLCSTRQGLVKSMHQINTPGFDSWLPYPLLSDLSHVT